MLWSNNYGGLNDEIIKLVQQTSDGGYILAGTTNSFGAGVYNYQGLLIKTNSSGDMLWNKTFGLVGGTNNTEVYSIEQTSDGGYLIGTASLLIKTNSSGDMLWNTTESHSPEINSVQNTSDGGYIIGENKYQGSGYVGFNDIFITREDLNENILWNRTYGGEYDDVVYAVLQTLDGGYIIAGATESFGTGDNYDALIIKLSGENNCDINLVNVSSEWADTAGCFANDTKQQERNITQYDSNFCGEVENQTYSEHREIVCSYCTATWESVNGSCYANDTFDIGYYYTNDCCSQTGLPSDCNIPANTTENCNYCSEDITGPFNTICVNKLLTQYYVDANYGACCALTNLSSDCHINNESYVNITLSCGGGGGGGGSGGGAPPILNNTAAQNQTSNETGQNLGSLEGGRSFNEGVGGSTSFILKGQNHKLKIISISGNTVDLQLWSKPANVTISVGETKLVDLDGNGYNDLIIALNGITGGKANLMLAEIAETAHMASANQTQTSATTQTIANKTKNMWWIWATVALVVIIIIAVVMAKKPDKRK